ncbi:MAG: YfhO family protein [Thermoanaerobaculia bacterium]
MPAEGRGRTGPPAPEVPLRTVVRDGLGAGLLLALLLYAPVLAGKVPLAAEIVSGFAAWRDVETVPREAPPHAELGDTVTQYYPWTVFTGRALHDRDLPLWNPHSLLGSPFLANSQSALLYPPTVLTYLLPASWAWGLDLALKCALAVLFGALLVRETAGSRAACVLGGVGFALCGFMVGWEQWRQTDSALWLPLLAASLLALHRQPTTRRVALTGAAFALPVLAGHPEIAFYVVCGATALWLWWLPASPRPVRAALLLAAAALLGLGLAAAQWLPTVEWIGGLLRSPARVLGFHLPPEQLVAWLSRDLRGNPNPVGVEVPLGAAYAGMVSLVLAPAAFLGRARHALFLALGLAVTVDVAYGLGPFYSLSQRLPLVQAMPHERILVLADVAVVLLGSLGLTALADGRIARRRRLTVLAAGSCTVALALSVATRWHSEAEALSGPWGLGSSWLFWALATAAGTVLVLRHPSPAPSGRVERAAQPPRVGWPEIATAAVVVLDLLSASGRLVPFFDREEVFPPAPVHGYLASRDPRYRVVAVDYATPDNSEMVFDLATPTGYDYVSRRAAAMLRPFVIRHRATGGSFSGRRVARADLGRRLSLLGVRWVLVDRRSAVVGAMRRSPHLQRVYDDGAVTVFENASALPRAFLVPLAGAREMGDAEQLERIGAADFVPDWEVLVPPGALEPWRGHRALRRRPRPLPHPEAAIGIDRVAVETDAGAAAALVVSQLYDGGWEASVDGEPAPLLRVDYAFQGVLLPRGPHRVELVYRPFSVRLGMVVSALSLVLLVVLVVYPRRAP